MAGTVKHTPGPWKAVAYTQYDSGLTYVSVQPETADPTTMRPLAMANGEHHVCRMSHTAAQHAIRMHLANARLIAAAPDLLDALKAAEELYQTGLIAASNELIDRVQTSRRAAIAKAEGQS